MDEKIVLTDESGEEIELYAVEETRVAGVNYLLAAEEEGDGACFELEYLFHIFKELVGDIDLEY